MKRKTVVESSKQINLKHMLLMDTLVEKLIGLITFPTGILSRRKPRAEEQEPVSRQVRRALERKKKSATGCK